MSNVVPFHPQEAAAIMERLIVQGDVSGLTPQERAEYYLRVCQSVGLNPLTQPFDYIRLNGKLKLYALKGCTDQLRRLHNISVTELSRSVRGSIFIVTAMVSTPDGRTDQDIGSVCIANLAGDALANAMMKAATKAKRRATLAICGLGLLDETELETIPDSAWRQVAEPARNVVRTIAPAPKHRLAHDRAARSWQRPLGPSKPFLASEAGKEFARYDERNPPPHDDSTEAAKALNRRLHPLNDEIPEHAR